MTELIVALDFDDALTASNIAELLNREAGVGFFKIGARVLMHPYSADLIDYLSDYDLMFDFKLYDTRDTVAATAARAFALGARFLTVHAMPLMLAAAMGAKTDERQKVLAVNELTDLHEARSVTGPAQFDGIICSVQTAYEIQLFGGKPEGKIIVCPGIRPRGTSPDNHVRPATPAEARAAGADYVVVGRPIIAAADPVAAARAIMEELSR